MATIIEWVRYLICSNKTRIKIWNDTLLENFPLLDNFHTGHLDSC